MYNKHKKMWPGFRIPSKSKINNNHVSKETEKSENHIVFPSITVHPTFVPSVPPINNNHASKDTENHIVFPSINNDVSKETENHIVFPSINNDVSKETENHIVFPSINNDVSKETENHVVFSAVSKNKLLKENIKVVELNLELEATVTHKLIYNSYRSKLKINYNSDKEHNGFYVIKNIKGLWSEIKKGISLVINNGKSIVYGYISTYDKETESLKIVIIDTKGTTIKFNGEVKITIILMPINNFVMDKVTNNDYFIFSNDNINTMCR